MTRIKIGPIVRGALHNKLGGLDMNVAEFAKETNMSEAEAKEILYGEFGNRELRSVSITNYKKATDWLWG